LLWLAAQGDPGSGQNLRLDWDDQKNLAGPEPYASEQE
jgi:hypothetical protein